MPPGKDSRPKAMATVVVFLRLTPRRSSTPVPASVKTASALHDPDGRSLSEARSAGMHRRRQQRPLLARQPHPLIRGTAGGDEVGDQVEGAPRVRGRPRVTA
jgi:hypothetical protein